MDKEDAQNINDNLESIDRTLLSIDDSIRELSKNLLVVAEAIENKV